MSVINPVVNPVAGGSGLNQHNVQNVQLPIQGNNDTANLARQIQANTNVTMKTEVVKLPDFYGDPSKDTITALEFMAHIDKCQITNDWNDVTTFSYFQLALRGQADKWLSSVVRYLQLMLAQKTWTRITPSFKMEFAALFMTSSLLMASQTYTTGMVKIQECSSPDWRNSFTFSNYASYRVNLPDQLKRWQEVILKMHSPKPSTTTWTTSPISCSPK